ncbi:hypothetical protein CMP1-03 [Clavibacter phage CMP1]|uniref:Uncharacterized protein n=1 Tax=Clavibacter phage CMP1 TaxID=686439 RepID=D0U1Y7_9CAUD|nr:hypothetical protein CMP1-03 [Clavibacter phage CMP1]ACY35899.1 hypothetical protein CMP1-03 [Clavibacter phage CMP1]
MPGTNPRIRPANYEEAKRVTEAPVEQFLHTFGGATETAKCDAVLMHGVIEINDKTDDEAVMWECKCPYNMRHEWHRMPVETLHTQPAPEFQLVGVRIPEKVSLGFADGYAKSILATDRMDNEVGGRIRVLKLSDVAKIIQPLLDELNLPR